MFSHDTSWLAFAIGHPCFLVPDGGRHIIDDDRPAAVITGYLDLLFGRSSNPEGVRRAGNHHRMLNSYLNSLARAGFTLEQSSEPAANELLASQQPFSTQVPIFFAARVRKPL